MGGANGWGGGGGLSWSKSPQSDGVGPVVPAAAQRTNSLLCQEVQLDLIKAACETSARRKLHAKGSRSGHSEKPSASSDEATRPIVQQREWNVEWLSEENASRHACVTEGPPVKALQRGAQVQPCGPLHDTVQLG